jgi:NTE family protein
MRTIRNNILCVMCFGRCCVSAHPGWGWQGAGSTWLLATSLLLSGCAGLVSTPSSPPPTVPAGPDVPAVAAPAPRLPVLGLALGGGAARGFAHVGVIQVLEEAGYRPQLVAGTSAGSLVAALYASGRSGAELQRLADGMEAAAFADWTLPWFQRGVLRGEALARYVSQQVGGRAIEQMPLPLGIVATDLASGEAVLFRRGDTATAVRASSAVPAVFLPVRILGRDHVDGGLVAPVPVQQAREMGAEVVLAVDISSAPEGNTVDGTLQVLLQTFAVMGRSISRYALRDADVVVRPALVGVGGTDFSKRQRAIEAGRAAMREALPALQKAMAPR